MVIKDLIGLEKPLEKLIETIGEGFGVVGNHVFEFDTKKVLNSVVRISNSPRTVLGILDIF